MVSSEHPLDTTMMFTEDEAGRDSGAPVDKSPLEVQSAMPHPPSLVDAKLDTSHIRGTSMLAHLQHLRQRLPAQRVHAEHSEHPRARLQHAPVSTSIPACTICDLLRAAADRNPERPTSVVAPSAVCSAVPLLEVVEAGARSAMIEFGVTVQPPMRFSERAVRRLRVPLCSVARPRERVGRRPRKVAGRTDGVVESSPRDRAPGV